MQKRFSDAASEKPHDYVPDDEMKHDCLLWSPVIKNELRRNIKSDRQKLRRNLRFSSEQLALLGRGNCRYSWCMDTRLFPPAPFTDQPLSNSI